MKIFKSIAFVLVQIIILIVCVILQELFTLTNRNLFSAISFIIIGIGVWLKSYIELRNHTKKYSIIWADYIAAMSVFICSALHLLYTWHTTGADLISSGPEILSNLIAIIVSILILTISVIIHIFLRTGERRLHSDSVKK